MDKERMATVLLTLLVTLSATTVVVLEAKTVFPTILLEPKSVLSTLGVFETGNFSTITFDVGTSSITTSPPRPLLIVSPIKSGKYPIIFFHHGTSLRNSWYNDLLKHVSSHGYIVVAPQYYEMLPPNACDELDFAAKVANWLPSGLQLVLHENVVGDLDKLAISGHSRGGYVAFALALGLAKTPLKVNLRALVGVDPVAGQSKNNQLEPKILTYVPDSFNLSIPVSVIGTGLGNNPVLPLMPACAPKGVNHKEFFNECKSPCAHFVTTNYGHMDMLNDQIGARGHMLRSMCKGCSRRVSRDPMRRTIGGIIVAFLQASFEGETKDYMTILQNHSVAPAKLDSVMFKEAQYFAEV